MLRRRALAVALLALMLAAGYWFWLRDSSLVDVDEVSFSGAGERTDLTAQIEAVALEQSTLDVDEAGLLEAVASDPAVRGLEATPEFPHRLEVELDLRSPVGYLSEAGVVVADDGVVLEAADNPPGDVPAIEVEGSGGAPAPGEGLSGEAAEVTTVLGATPKPLLAELTAARIEPGQGIVVIAGDGLELRFGEATRADAKWEAAAAVLADPQLGAIDYIDLSLPERPVAGSGTSAAPPPGETKQVEEGAAATDAGAAATGEGVAGAVEATPADPLTPSQEPSTIP